jgi:hypothetical protein
MIRPVVVFSTLPPPVSISTPSPISRRPALMRSPPLRRNRTLGDHGGESSRLIVPASTASGVWFDLVNHSAATPIAIPTRPATNPIQPLRIQKCAAPAWPASLKPSDAIRQDTPVTTMVAIVPNQMGASQLRCITRSYRAQH